MSNNISVADIQKEVDRELRMREQVYRSLMKQGRLSEEDARRRMDRMRAVALVLADLAKDKSVWVDMNRRETHWRSGVSLAPKETGEALPKVPE